MNYHVRKSQSSDFPKISDIHINELKNDLLPFFGVQFLSEHFYPMLYKSDECEIYVTYHDTELCGFIVIDITGDGIKKAASKLHKELMLAGLKNILGTIKFIPQMISILFSSNWSGEIAEIAFVATKHDYQRQGIGKYMINYVLKSLSLPCIVKTSETSAKKFYEKLGFVSVGTERRGFRHLDVLKLENSTHEL